jgi:hypothetical protein
MFALIGSHNSKEITPRPTCDEVWTTHTQPHYSYSTLNTHEKRFITKHCSGYKKCLSVSHWLVKKPFKPSWWHENSMIVSKNNYCSTQVSNYDHSCKHM